MINHNRAYILGLLVGGGKLDKNTFIIELPFEKWGMDPYKMSVIAVDILQRVSQIFDKEYSIKLEYEIGNSKWFIKPIGDNNFDTIKNDLELLKLPKLGFLLKNADLTYCKEYLKGINAESFLSGIFDTRASLTLSHRRFVNEAPVVSIEIPGSTNNFKFVVQLCSWLTELGSITDQILYNHPNQHSPSDPTYKNWKKGFKIRFLIKSFLAKHSFALQAKSIDAKLIEKNQKKFEQNECPLRQIRKPSPVSIHNDINSKSLPLEVRNKLFLHYFHFCASLDCKYAPKNEVKNIINRKNEFISFFPRLSKGDISEVNEIFFDISKNHFNNSKIIKKNQKVSDILSNDSQYKDYYGLEQGIAYLFAPRLKGKRHLGEMNAILKKNQNQVLTIKELSNSGKEPIMIINIANNRAFICSDISSETNQKLIKNKIGIKNFNINLT